MVFYEFYSCYSASFILGILRVLFSVFYEFDSRYSVSLETIDNPLKS